MVVSVSQTSKSIVEYYCLGMERFTTRKPTSYYKNNTLVRGFTVAIRLSDVRHSGKTNKQTKTEGSAIAIHTDSQNNKNTFSLTEEELL